MHRTNDDARKRDVGESIRRARMTRGLSAAELAKRASIRAGTLSDVENGKSFPDLSTLLAIADALESSLDEVLGRAPRPVPPTPNRLGALEGDVALLFQRGQFQEQAIREILNALAGSNLLKPPYGERLQQLLGELQARSEGRH